MWSIVHCYRSVCSVEGYRRFDPYLTACDGGRSVRWRGWCGSHSSFEMLRCVTRSNCSWGCCGCDIFLKKIVWHPVIDRWISWAWKWMNDVRDAIHSSLWTRLNVNSNLLCLIVNRFHLFGRNWNQIKIYYRYISI